MIYDLWDGYLDKSKVRGLVPCCGQDGYRAQVPQQPIDSFRCIYTYHDDSAFSIIIVLAKNGLIIFFRDTWGNPKIPLLSLLKMA